MSTQQLPYGDIVYRLSHPGHLAAIGTLFGFSPPPVSGCRVLELGCGSGFNLLAISQSIPGGTFVGVDLDVRHIQRGEAVAQAIGARNVAFHNQSIQDFRLDGPPFDYIIANGLYSWIPAEARDALLAIIERDLAPAGIAFLSYNTNPGWRLRGLVRDALQFAGGATVSESRQFVNQLVGSLANPESIYSRALTAEWQGASANPDYYLAHEHLPASNHPVYFEEFTADAARRNLQFLAEARLPANTFLLDKAMRAQLQGTGTIRREQHLDWLVGRYFRQSLLCRASLKREDEPHPNCILDLNVALAPEVIGAAWSEMEDAGYRAVLGELHRNGERPVPARALIAPVLQQLDESAKAAAAKFPGVEGPMLAGLLWSGLADGIWTLRADMPAMAAAPSEFPKACPLARYQASAATGDITNRMHRSVELSAEERELLLRLDGTFQPAPGATLDRLAALALLTP